MDELDRNILFELDRNSRLTFSEIARNLSIPHDTVRYRVRSLEDRKIVNKFHTAVDTSKLGYLMYEMFIKLFTSSEEKFQKLVKFLIKKPFVTWVARTEGGYDLGIAFRINNPAILSDFVDELLEHYGELIIKKSLQANITCDYLGRGYLLGEKQLVKRKVKKAYIPHYSSGPIIPIQLERIDELILKKLGESSRHSAAEISRYLAANGIVLSSESVSIRITKLENERIINGYTLALNHSRMNQIHYKVFLYLNQVERQRIQEFLDSCRNSLNVSYLVKSLGEWEYELDIEVPDVTTYRKTMLRITEKHPGIIKDYVSIILTEILKYTTAEIL
jgi:Lrp/AsnC family leucine-responsive transcriptional regulator